ncbi:hypothetical protein [Maritalea mediterranea]|uniref:Uncharacterized protein n=1 Tax=Maritalea mediterranea TaxID=2909667 RepID=A0ABS9E580_9HYPH|nr:hypothetical protein [Maritalea mediterranea]MCF4098015.1 hypothetical protein [Maritalea mediterranea]
MQDQRTKDNNQETLNKTEARQAQRGFSTRVLLISLPLIILAFVAIYIFADNTDTENPEIVDAPSLESSETVPTD